jgi:hypothetical protein
MRSLGAIDWLRQHQAKPQHCGTLRIVARLKQANQRVAHRIRVYAVLLKPILCTHFVAPFWKLHPPQAGRPAAGDLGLRMAGESFVDPHSAIAPVDFATLAIRLSLGRPLDLGSHQSIAGRNSGSVGSLPRGNVRSHFGSTHDAEGGLVLAVGVDSFGVHFFVSRLWLAARCRVMP